LPEVVSVRTPLKSTGYGLANVRPIFAWEAGDTVPLGPVKLYEGRVGGAVPDPSNGTEVLSIWSTPLAKLVVSGVKVIMNCVDCPAFSVSGSAGGGVSENGLAPLAVELVPIFEIVVGNVPELVRVNVTLSDLLTATGLNMTAFGGTTGMVPAGDV
jgi:hypothetical protein